jgi:osmoprotectant transport system permease protein
LFRRTGSHDILAIAGCAVGLLSFCFGWLVLKPNRLSTGTSLSLWDSFGWTGAAIVGCLWLTCLAFSLAGKTRGNSIAIGVLANLILVSTFALAGQSSDTLLVGSSPIARVSLSSGVWLSLMAALMVIFASRTALKGSAFRRSAVSWAGLAGVLALLLAGWLDNVSVVKEYVAQQPRFIQELQTHIQLFAASTLFGVVLGVPLGVWASHRRGAEKPIFFLTGIAQTVPSLALFGLLIGPLSALSAAIPALRVFGVSGIGIAPALIALTIYCLLPIIQNTYAGFHHVDSSVVDAGLGMGMTRFVVLRRIEFPLAAPLVLEGVRTAAVQAVGNTAVAALIGAGGLGQLIFQGLGQAAPDLIILGSIPIIMLALIVDETMRIVVGISKPRVAAKEA